MPYKLKLVGESGGFKVCDMNKKCYSKTPLTKRRAIAQRVAIALSESKKTGEPPSHYFA
jgi:hypothetical protein